VPGWSTEYHTAPRRQLVVQLSGVGELECGDGSTRQLRPGDLLLADDTTGEGHRSREVEGPRRQLLIYLDPALDVDTLARG
jgi:quercetin dioxygenase-like cupin family protein